MKNRLSIALILLIGLVSTPLNSCVPPQPPVNEVPTADFTFSPAGPVADQSVTFNDSSTDADGIITG